MLSNLTIKNFAIIKETSLNFDLGFNVFMGATGAGKSIIIDALNFVLGDKASKDNIRHNQNTLLVKAVFENVNNTTKSLLDDFCIAQDDDLLILTRTFSIDGKSSCLINGESVTLSMLKQVGQSLVDSYCQHDGVQLLKTSNHIKLLDSNCPAVVGELKAKISELLHQIKEIDENIEKLGGSAENRQRLIDLLTYQINEIESANLKEGEEENLRSQLSVAANAELLNSNLSQVCQMFDSANLSSVCSVLNGIIKFDDRLGCLYERMNSSVLELEDIVESLKQLKNSINFDESEIDSLNERLDLIKNLNKKYGGDYFAVIEFL
ncbi:MAG: AAA family ATPase, partial [Clostridia bacterium]|nr:AAA family ATPase [Clostridia bacterium]